MFYCVAGHHDDFIMTAHPLLTPTASSLPSLISSQIALSATSTAAATAFGGAIHYKLKDGGILLEDVIPRTEQPSRHVQLHSQLQPQAQIQVQSQSHPTQSPVPMKQSPDYTIASPPKPAQPMTSTRMDAS